HFEETADHSKAAATGWQMGSDRPARQSLSSRPCGIERADSSIAQHLVAFPAQPTEETAAGRLIHSDLDDFVIVYRCRFLKTGSPIAFIPPGCSKKWRSL